MQIPDVRLEAWITHLKFNPDFAQSLSLVQVGILITSCVLNALWMLVPVWRENLPGYAENPQSLP